MSNKVMEKSHDEIHVYIDLFFPGCDFSIYSLQHGFCP